MKTRILALTIVTLFFITIQSFCQSDSTIWKRGAKGAITFTQVGLKNWASGGENSLALNTYLNLFTNHANGRRTWDNSLELGYGLIDQGDLGVRKSDDKIILATIFGYQLKEEGKLFWSTLLDFKTQFTEGLEYPNDSTEVRISDFLAPGYFTISTGLDWKPSEFFSVLYSPITGKITIVGDLILADNGAFGVEPAEYDPTGLKIKDGANSRFEFGSFVRVVFKKDIATNVNLESKMELFSAYDETFGNIDVNWQNSLTMKVNDWLVASFITQLMYDDDIDIATAFDPTGVPLDSQPRVQYKQILSVGITYTLGDK